MSGSGGGSEIDGSLGGRKWELEVEWWWGGRVWMLGMEV